MTLFKSTLTLAAAAALIAGAVAAHPALAARESHEQRVEERITMMHAKLGITPEEEGQWARVADVMRENAREIDALANERKSKAGSMDAVDDLESYSEIAEAHADGIRKLTPVFAELYDNMSDVQKDEADELFRRGQHHHHSED
jgi:hypothetical protein